MIEQLATVDAGGSGTRIIYNRGDRKYRKAIPSRLKKIPENLKVYKDLEDPTEDFIIYGRKFEGRYVKGFAMSNHREGEVMQPDNQLLKVDQDVTYINILHSIANILLPLKTEEQIKVNLGVVIPASEFCSSREDLIKSVKEKLAGQYEVIYPALDRSVNFKLNESTIYVSGEGLAYTMVLAKDERYKDLFTNANGIVIDVGRRSIDITPIRKRIPVKKAARSVATGGIQVESRIMSEAELAGHPITNEEIFEVIKTGKINGFNVCANIIDAKKSLAADLKEHITSVLSIADWSIANLGYVVLMGQLFNDDDVLETSDNFKGNLSSYVSKYLPTSIQIITPPDQEFANCDAMYSIVSSVHKV